MLAVKIIVFVLVICNGVLGRDTRKENVRHNAEENEYKYNHPPVPENYAAIPVAVVYEDESSRVDKSIKNSPSNNIMQVNKEPLNSDSSVTEEPNDIQVSKKHIDANPTNVEQEEPKVTTYRPQKELQVPVAVVYDQEPTYYQKPQPNRNRSTNKRRKSQRLVSQEKQSTVENPIPVVNGHTGSILTANKPEQLNVQREVQLPNPKESQSMVENNSNSSSGHEENTSPALADGKTETPETVTQADTPSSDEGNEYSTSITETEKPDKSQRKIQRSESTLRKIQRKEKNSQVTSTDGSVRSSVRNENTPSKTKENEQQLSSHGNLTRVREVIPIIQSENLVYSQSGNFRYSYEAGDGTKAFEKGELKTFDDENTGEAVSGGFSYTGKDGNEYSLSYTADENGYRPVGAHLPTPPPIPPAIARALAYLATKPTPEPVTESLVEDDE